MAANDRRDPEERTQTGANDGATIDELHARNADDPTLGLTNVPGRPPEDWAADTGPTRAAESSGGIGWDPLRTQITPSEDGVPVREMPPTLEKCLLQELQDLYQAESEQTRALEMLAHIASAKELKSAFQDHLAETQQQLERLDQILGMMGESPGGSGTVPTSLAGVIEESREKLGQGAPTEDGKPSLRDVLVIAEARKMEHNEIASYGTARAMAHTLGRDQEAHLLQTTLTEEKKADDRLGRIALRLLKRAVDEAAWCEIVPESDRG